METKPIIHRNSQGKYHWSFENMNRVDIPIELKQKQDRENRK